MRAKAGESWIVARKEGHVGTKKGMDGVTTQNTQGRQY